MSELLYEDQELLTGLALILEKEQAASPNADVSSTMRDREEAMRQAKAVARLILQPLAEQHDKMISILSEVLDEFQRSCATGKPIPNDTVVRMCHRIEALSRATGK